MVTATSNAYEVLAIRYASRQAVKSEELERDRPSAVVADLRQMYRAFDQLRELASQATGR